MDVVLFGGGGGGGGGGGVIVVAAVFLSFSPLWNDYNDDSDKRINGLRDNRMITAHFLFP